MKQTCLKPPRISLKGHINQLNSPIICDYLFKKVKLKLEMFLKDRQRFHSFCFMIIGYGSKFVRLILLKLLFQYDIQCPTLMGQGICSNVPRKKRRIVVANEGLKGIVCLEYAKTIYNDELISGKTLILIY